MGNRASPLKFHQFLLGTDLTAALFIRANHGTTGRQSLDAVIGKELQRGLSSEKCKVRSPGCLLFRVTYVHTGIVSYTYAVYAITYAHI